MDLKILGLVSVLMVGLVAGAWAFMGTPEGAETGEQKAQMTEHREQVMQALEAGDYETWSELSEGKPIAEQITEENFERFVEMHEHMKAAKEIQEELGLPGRGMRGGRGRMKGNMKMVQNCNCE